MLFIQLNTVQRQCFIVLYCFGKRTLILNLIPATQLKKVEMGATKDWESSGMLRKYR